MASGAHGTASLNTGARFGPGGHPIPSRVQVLRGQRRGCWQPVPRPGQLLGVGPAEARCQRGIMYHVSRFSATRSSLAKALPQVGEKLTKTRPACRGGREGRCRECVRGPARHQTVQVTTLAAGFPRFSQDAPLSPKPEKPDQTSKPLL